MRWTVSGADRSNGNQRTMVVDADSEAEAVQTANIGGVVVANVAPIREPVAKLPPMPTADSVPSYAGLSLASVACMTFAMVGVVAGIAVLFYGISRAQTDLISLGAGFLLGGGIYLAIGSALDALRDIARNSWR